MLHACNYAIGEVLSATASEAIRARYGLASLVVHRGDLHSVLLAAARSNDPDAVHVAHEFRRPRPGRGG